MNSTKKMQCWIIVGMLFMFVSIWNTEVSRAAEVQADTFSDLHRAKIYLASGDYRRAVEACQQHINKTPSVESYVYLIYVYHALDGYVEWLAKRDNWGDVGRLAISMVDRGTLDLVDPPDMLARMAKEILKEGVRHQFDIVAGMANRLNKSRADKMWLERKAWQEAHPNDWWAGIPESWNWQGIS